MDFHDARILVTGGAGFIGSEVVRQLSEAGAYVRVLDNLSSGREEYIRDGQRVELVEGDVADHQKVRESLKDVEYVVNMAALPFIPDSYAFPEDFFRINVNGTLAVILEGIRNNSVRKVVHISSSEVYGSALTTPMKEDHPTLPHSTYAVSKLAGERAAFTLYKEHGLDTVIIRPFNSYGHRITQPYIIPEIALQLLNNKTELMLGNVNSSRDFTFVEDTARGIISAIASKKAVGETINLGSGNAISIKDLAFLMADILGLQISISTDKSRFRPYDVNMLICDNTKAKKLLAWEPTIDMRTGLTKTLEWIKEHKPVLKRPFKGWPEAVKAR